MTRQRNENSRETTSRRPSQWLRRFCLTLIAILTLCVAAGARNAFDLICFPDISSFQLVNGNQPPTIDGVITGDLGWTGASTYVFGNGATIPDVIVQGLRDHTNSNLYLSIQANNMMDWDQFTWVTVAFDPGGGAPQQALVIRPIQANVTSGSASAPAQISYYHSPYPFSAPATPWAPAPQIMTGYQTAGGTNYQ